MKLSSDWRRCWRWLTMHFAALAAIAPQIYDNSDALQSFLPDSQYRFVQSILGALVIWSLVRKKNV